MERIICLLIGYAFGLIQTSYIYGRACGIDIRTKGSGNAGTPNALRTLGRKAGLVTVLVDSMKCVAAVALVRLIFGNSHHEIIRLLCIYTSAGVILGHDFPFYLGFRGGKGIAATAGMIIAFLDWRLIVAGIICFFGCFLATHYVSLGSLALSAEFLVGVILLGQLGTFQEMPGAARCEMYLIVALLTLMAFCQHRGNIGRLIRGNERKTYLSKKNKTSEGVR